MVAAVAAGLPRGGVPLEAQVALCVAVAVALLLAPARPGAPGNSASSENPKSAGAVEPGSADGVQRAWRAWLTRGRGVAFLAPALVVLWGLWQCVPLPFGLLRALSPAAAALRALPPAVAPGSAPLSLDWPATLSALAVPAAAACALAAAGMLTERSRRLLCAAPFVAALLQALIGFARFDGGVHGTFVNRNHLAALLVFGALTALGAGLVRTERRVLWLLGSALCAAAALLTLSRGAALALVAGVLLILVRQRRRTMVAILVPALALSAGLYLAGGPLLDRAAQLAPGQLVSTDVKVRSFGAALRTVPEFPLFGVGRGTWGAVSELHRSVPGEVTFVYVENEPLQLAAELGLPLALLVLALLAWGFFSAQPAPGLELGAAAGLLALALQNLVDFNLELMGVALPAAVALGALCGSPRFPWLARGGALLAAAACAGLVFATPLLSDAELAARAPGMQARHPADWLVSLSEAVQQLEQKKPGAALAWAVRAQELSPRSWRAHAVSAAALLQLGRPAQARVETKLALAGGNYSLIPGDALDVAARSAHGLDELLEATPAEPPVRAALVQRLHERGRDDEARAVAREELALAAGEARHTLLQSLAELTAGDELRALARELPGCEGTVALARADPAHAEELLQPCATDWPAAQQLFELRLKRGGDALAVIDRFLPGEHAADAHALKARALRALGRNTEAAAEERTSQRLR